MVNARLSAVGAELSDTQVPARFGALLRLRAVNPIQEKKMAKDHGPQIKDDDQYEELREQGMSKEKAARIANTARTTAGKRGGSSPAYEEWSKGDLYERARDIGIDGRSGMTKRELIDSLRNP